MRLKTLAILVAALIPASASAAEFIHEKDKDGAIILIFGEIKPGDENKFRELSIRYPDAMVGLDSIGGAIVPALEIGRQIRLRGYSTVVTESSKCTSACALIWLAGSPRYLETGGSLGFHASYKDQGGKLVETGLGNALVGHYLSQLNLSERAVIFATSASPYQISWLNDANRGSAGIEFASVAGTRKASTVRNAPPSPPPPVYIPRPAATKYTTEQALAELEGSEPFYAALRIYHPAEYARLKTIVEQGLASGNRQKMRRDLRQTITPLVLKKVPTAPDATLVKFVQLMVEQTRFVQAERPNSCSEYLAGEDIGLDAFAAPSMVRREVQLYDEILRARPVPPPRKFSDDELADALTEPLSGMSKRLNLTIDEMVEAMQQRGPEVRQCQVAAALYDALMSLPNNRGIPLVRFLIAE